MGSSTSRPATSSRRRLTNLRSCWSFVARSSCWIHQELEWGVRAIASTWNCRASTSADWLTKHRRVELSSETTAIKFEAIWGDTKTASKGIFSTFLTFSLAKTKSISFLARSSLQKSNIICPIYRRLGKCLAYANGRCNKVHDQRYVIVCPSFLRDSCNDEKCLLSHNANLHKMPVCKYFLQGLCQKQGDCRYLHKKLTDDTKLCAEFIKGYCPLAGKVTQSGSFRCWQLTLLIFSANCCMTSPNWTNATGEVSRSCAAKRRRSELRTSPKKHQAALGITSTSQQAHPRMSRSGGRWGSCHHIFRCKLCVIFRCFYFVIETIAISRLRLVVSRTKWYF